MKVAEKKQPQLHLWKKPEKIFKLSKSMSHIFEEGFYSRKVYTLFLRGWKSNDC